MKYFVIQHNFSDHNVIIDQRDPVYAYKAISDPYTMHLHEAMKKYDWPNFRLARQKEIDNRRKVITSLSFINQNSQVVRQTKKVTQDSHSHSIMKHWKWQQTIV